MPTCTTTAAATDTDTTVTDTNTRAQETDLGETDVGVSHLTVDSKAAAALTAETHDDGLPPPEESKLTLEATASGSRISPLNSISDEVKVNTLVKPPTGKSSTLQKTRKKSAKKTSVKSSAARTIAKSKNARPKAARAAEKSSKIEMDEADSSEAEEESVSAIPFSGDDFPQLVLDRSNDYSELANAFKKPLFNNPSRTLEIAYSQLLAVKEKRREAQRKKNAILQEYNQLREKFLQKKLELSLADDEVKAHSQIVGAWTRKVFDLELEEDCAWNTNYKKLKKYKESHGKLPPNAKKAKDEEEKSLSAWLDRIRRQKTQEDKGGDSGETGKKKPKKNKKFANDSPHRIEYLAELGVVWESHHENKWETMFQKLLHYKEEMGTLRFPPDDQCAATGDTELIALQKWVKSQVLSVRHGKKKTAETTKRLLDIGFDFEKWYARSGKKRRTKEEDDAVDDVGAIARNTMQEGDCRQPTTMMLASSDRNNVEMEV